MVPHRPYPAIFDNFVSLAGVSSPIPRCLFNSEMGRVKAAAIMAEVADLEDAVSLRAPAELVAASVRNKR